MNKKPEKDVNEIIPNLWLGNYIAAYDKTFIQKYNIKRVISLIENFNIGYKVDGVKYLTIPISDKNICNINMANIFDLTNKFIKEGLEKNEGVLVHCKRGHHRSATIVAAYLINNNYFDYHDSIKYIVSLRPNALQRNTCIHTQLFDYYLKSKKITNCNKTCNYSNNIYYCKCK